MKPAAEADLSIAAVVIDRDYPEPNPAAVVNLPPKRADEWDARWSRGEPVTVAEDNPGYPANAQVVEVVYLDRLREAYPTWSGESAIRLTDLNEREVNHYAFPRPRLQRVGELEADDAAGEEVPVGLAVGFRAFTAHLDEVYGAQMDGSRSPPALIVERDGVTYRITADGRVEGDGPLTERLEDLASTYLR
jgi:ParB family chromosome partitioning protein